MNRKKRKEAGAVAIEAVLSLTIFMLAILALMMGSMLMRAQASMQYALNQTAKEISGYFYLLDKFGIASMLSENTTDVADANLQKMNTSIGHIISFSGDLKEDIKSTKNDLYETAENAKNGNLTQADIDRLKSIKEDEIGKIKKEVKTLKGDLKELKNGDKKQMFKAVIQVFSRACINTVFSKYLTPLVCEALLPKYLTSGDVDEYYRNIGIIPESINFDGSHLLGDGRSISLVVEYEMDASKLTLGFYKKNLIFRQVASTAAWIHKNESGSLQDLETVGWYFAEGYAKERDEELTLLNKKLDEERKKEEEEKKKEEEEKKKVSDALTTTTESAEDTTTTTTVTEKPEKTFPKGTAITEDEFMAICKNGKMKSAYKWMPDEERRLFLIAITKCNAEGKPIDENEDGKPDIDMELFNKINGSKDPEQLMYFLSHDLQNIEDKPENDSWREGTLQATAFEKANLLKQVGNRYRKFGDGKEMLTPTQTYEILSQDKGERPDPKEYLSESYIDEHLQQFKDEGFVVIQGAGPFNRFTSQTHKVGYDKDGNDPNGSLFVLTKSAADEVFAKAEEAYANNDPSTSNISDSEAYYRSLEDSLGFPRNSFGRTAAYRIDVDPSEIASKDVNLRMATGNERGASGLWVPGGYTSGGYPEAIVDQITVKKGNCKAMMDGDKILKDEVSQNTHVPWN